VLPPLPERRWNKRKSTGPTLRQHELDVLAFLKARLKPKTRRAAALRRTAPAPATEQPDAETAPRLDELKPTGS